MSIAIAYPRYSFIQGMVSSGDTCYGDPNFCLPLSSTANLQTEIKLTGVDTGMSLTLALSDILLLAVPMDYDCDPHTFPAISLIFTAAIINKATHKRYSGITQTEILYFDSPQAEFDSQESEGTISWPEIGECFKVVLAYHTGGETNANVLGCIGCFKRTVSSCNSSVISYSNREDAFDFDYPRSDDTYFVNVVELPMYLRDPIMSDDTKVYTRSDGSIDKLYARIEEQYTLETDYMPYTWLKALNIALSHDSISIVNSDMRAFDYINTATTFQKKENLEIEYQKGGQLTALGKGQCKIINASPIHLFNNNCR